MRPRPACYLLVASPPQCHLTTRSSRPPGRLGVLVHSSLYFAPAAAELGGVRWRYVVTFPMLSSAEVTTLLSKLCVDLGFCLPPIDCERLRAECPPDVLAFTDAVFAAAGFAAGSADLGLHRRVKAEVTAAFHRHEEREELASLLPARTT